MSIEFELDVWRALGRDIALGESIHSIGALLAARMPIDILLLRRIEFAQDRLETVASSVVNPGPEPAAIRTVCTADAVRRLDSWCRRGNALLADIGSDALLDLAVPRGVHGSAIAVPIADDGRPMGLLLLISRKRGALREKDRKLAALLIEPMGAALKNNRLLHEMARSREALEADKRALLSQLEYDTIADTIVGVESGLRQVMDRVDQVAPTDVPVLLLGETGTGKEVLARAIHARSGRSSGPMVRVNCGAIPSELVDSELFGHEKGSFTGAIAARRGWFERADGGTLLLDEFAELTPAAQVRLLRILQDGTLERVGGERTITVDVRIIAATARDIESMVSEGAFREDLWYRISVFPIGLPPLRERPEDIPALAAHLALRAARRMGAGPLVPSPEDMRQLMSYGWPGNIRELAAVIDRSAILGGGKRLEIAAALGISQSFKPRVRNSEANGPKPEPEATPGELLTIDEAMARHMEKALAATNGRIEGHSGAAALLGINPHTLRARMRKLGVDWKKFRPPGA